MHPVRPTLSRRGFLRAGSLLAAALPASRLLAVDSITLPFANGERPLVKYPQKRPLIRHTTRPATLPQGPSGRPGSTTGTSTSAG